MSCLDEKSLDLKEPVELKKVFDGHSWEIAYYDQFGESGVIVRYNCSNCGKEWTSLLLDPSKLKTSS